MCADVSSSNCSTTISFPKITRTKSPSGSLYGKVRVDCFATFLFNRKLFSDWCWLCNISGIRKNENGFPEDEENFEEAIKSVNTALNPTKVFCLKKSSSNTLTSNLSVTH